MVKQALASKTLWMCAGLAVLALALVTNGTAAKEQLSVGQAMPDFTMTSVRDGEEHSLSDHEGEIVVLSFCSQDCPWSRGADPALSKIAEKYQEKGVVFYGINADRNHEPTDVAKYAKEHDTPYPVLKDTQNTYADKVGASRTPELYVVDKDGNLAYHGAFDDRKVPTQEGETNYLTQALDELLAGKEVSTPKVSAWGCGIKRVS